MEDYRNRGIQMLGLYFKKERNIKMIEQKIYEYILTRNDTHLVDYYNDIIIEVCIQKGSIKDIWENVLNKKIDWFNVTFEPFQQKIDEYDLFLEKPFEIEDGVIECNRCGSKQTYSYTKQTRSGDEATTVFSVCAKCNAKWKT